MYVYIRNVCIYVYANIHNRHDMLTCVRAMTNECLNTDITLTKSCQLHWPAHREWWHASWTAGLYLSKVDSQGELFALHLRQKGKSCSLWEQGKSKHMNKMAKPVYNVCVCVCVGGPTMYAHPRGHHAGNLKVCHLPIRVWRNWVQQWITFPTWQARVKSYWFAVPENWNQWLYIYIYNYN